MTEKFRLTRRRLLGGALSVGAATAGAGAGTMALFGDSESSSGNAISMGTMDLVLTSNTGSSSPDGDGVTGTILAETDGKLVVPDNVHPGSELEGDVSLHSTGSLTTSDAPQVVDVDFGVTTTERGGSDDEGDTRPNDASKMAEQFRVVDVSYDPNNGVNAETTDEDIDGTLFLDDLVDGVPELTGLAPPEAGGGSTSFELSLEWADDADYDFTYSNNAYQGDEMDVTITFTLRQVTN